jgi:hypothetical protein
MQPSNDNLPPPVFVIIGRVRRDEDGPDEAVHILLTAPDDDSAVRLALEALASQSYLEAELDQIGELLEMPEEEPHASAYQGALEGEIAILTLGEE